MATLTSETEAQTTFRTIADILGRLEVPAGRILLHPTPGTATADDVVALRDRERRLAELVDGVLVEKAMGFKESRLAAVMVYLLELFLEQHDLGIVLGADGMMRLNPGLVRIPDASFLSWDQFPGRVFPNEAVPALHPNLAVEVLSAGNTPKEMARKLEEYFSAGSKLVWYLDPVDRTVRAYESPDRMTELDESGTLDGGEVLPDFRLEIRHWFERAERPLRGG